MIGGLVAALLGGGLSVIAFLKLIYYRFDTGTELSRAFATPFKNMVVELVNLVHMPSWLWNLAPTPDPENYLSTDNYAFGICYIVFIVGSLVFGSGLKLKRKLDEIDQEIEKEILKASVEGRPQRSKNVIKESLSVPQGSFISGMHKYYIAPLIVLVLGSLFLKWYGVI